MSPFQTVVYETDLCVVGGGLAGSIAAISAARHGARVVLIQDRPVLGGNSSSEIRMWVRGAKGYCNKETGILAELEEENIYRNPTLSPSLWDSVLFGKVKAEPNITLLLNASCLDAESRAGQVRSVTAWQLTTYTYHKVKARLFADCSGDAVLSSLVGARYRIGRESRKEYGERIGPEQADRKTMGMSLLLQARETDHPVPFIPPDWANVYETDADFAALPGLQGEYATFRDHQIGTSGCNLWWMELGGDSGEPIASAEQTRDELLRVAFGIWDHIKNRGDHGCENWELEWVGFLPGKRESVRYVGAYVLTQNDVEADRYFPDAIAYGGWPMDDHNPKGFLARGEEAPSKLYPAPSPYQIPYRCLYSEEIGNLMFAGRNISATHAAMSSTRVMGTCSLLGQALGTAAAICQRQGLLPGELVGAYLAELQKTLLDDGVMIPGRLREVSELTRSAAVNLTPAEREILLDGVERPRKEGDCHFVTIRQGVPLCFSLPQKCRIRGIRLQFDPDYSRESVSPNNKMRVFAQKLHCGLDFEPVKVPATLVRGFRIFADGQEVYQEENNYHSLVRVPLCLEAQELALVCDRTWGAERVNLFGCDLLGE